MTEQFEKSFGAELRVLQVASGDLWAGAEVQLFNMCEQLRASDEILLDVVLLNDGLLAERLREIGIAVTILDEASLSFWRICTALITHCRNRRPDIMHSHRRKENVLVALCGLRLRIPSIRTVHGAAESGLKRFSLRNMATFLDQWSGRFLQRRVVAVSKDLAQKLRKEYPESQVETIRNGIALSDLTIVRAADLPPGHTHIGMVGRLVPVKRIDLFLDAAAVLIRDDVDQRYQFWIVGDGPLLEQSIAQARSLNIADRVEFIGHVPSVIPYLQALDLLVMCSDHEGTPMTLLEALQCQVPIVAHDVGGIRELLEGGECGYLVSEQSAKEYATAVSHVLQSNALKEKYARNGNTRLQKYYSAESTASAYVKLYRKVISELH